MLEDRRRRGDMIEVFKVMRGINKVNKEEWFKMVDEEQRSTRQNATVVEDGGVERREVIKKERFRLDVRKNFFTIRVVDMWNGLPEHVKSATNVNMFKNRIDLFLKNNSWRSHE